MVVVGFVVVGEMQSAFRAESRPRLPLIPTAGHVGMIQEREDGIHH